MDAESKIILIKFRLSGLLSGAILYIHVISLSIDTDCKLKLSSENIELDNLLLPEKNTRNL